MPVRDLRAGYNRKLGVSDPAFMLISGAVDAGLGRIALMPLVVLAARLCPKVLLFHLGQNADGKPCDSQRCQPACA